MQNHNAISDKQTQKQRLSKSPLYGYRKPTFDGYHTWCNCVAPTLISWVNNKGMAYCLRCGHDWYI